jgi:hypothetical protein
LKALKNPNHIPSPIPESDNESSSSSDDNTPDDKCDQPVCGSKPGADKALDNLCLRVQDMRETLEDIILEPEESQFFCASRDTFKASSSQRSTSNSQALLDCIS